MNEKKDPGKAESEEEITTEMISAGVAALEMEITDLSAPLAFASQTVEAVYRAMRGSKPDRVVELPNQALPDPRSYSR
jgi:hypothetical protein